VAAPETSGAIDFEEARRLVIATCRALKPKPRVESVPIPGIRTAESDGPQAHGRILAEPILADRDYPAIARSLRDGFAVHSSDVPGELRVVGEVRAGESQTAVALKRGEALEVMTGAPVPAGADAVVMIEHVERTGSCTIKTARGADPSQWINPQGAEAKAGSVLIPAGVHLDASHISSLAMTGQTGVSVFVKPRVAILATGDEVVDLSDTPKPHQVRNSNSYALAALVIGAGGVPIILPVAKDRLDALLDSLAEGLRYDILLITGGVSTGKYDLVKPALTQLGAEFVFQRVRIQPGQPTAFGIASGKPVFGLPGNPGSSMVTFQLFAQPAIEISGGLGEPHLPILEATLSAPFHHKRGLTRFLPARLDGCLLRPIPWQGSSDVPALARANAFLVSDPEREDWAAGDRIRVMPKP
jgi:molybdopterin molybdotransferase